MGTETLVLPFMSSSLLAVMHQSVGHASIRYLSLVLYRTQYLYTNLPRYFLPRTSQTLLFFIHSIF